MSARVMTFDFVKLVEPIPKPRDKGVIEIRGPYYSSVGYGYLRDLLEDWSESVDGYKFAGGSMRLLPSETYLTALFTSAAILASSVAVNPFSAKAVGHMTLSSRFALSLKPNVAYLVLNFCAAWKKQTTLPSLAYAGIPYQSLGERAGVVSLMIAWSRLPRVRSGSGISAIFASTALSPSSLSAFSSWMRSLIAPCSSSVNPLNFLLIAVVLLADFCVPFCAGFMNSFRLQRLITFHEFTPCVSISLVGPSL